LIALILIAGCSNLYKQFNNESSSNKTVENETNIEIRNLSISSHNVRNITANFSQFYTSNLRWGRIPITVYIDLAKSKSNPSFNEGMLDDFRKALRHWEEKSGNTIKFQEVDDPNADITVAWDEHLKIQKGGDILGWADLRGWAFSGLFNVITNATILMIPAVDRCGTYSTTMHEFGHALGLIHSDFATDIMYRYIEANCWSDVTTDEANALNYLYSTPSLPDFFLENVSAQKFGKSVNLTFTVRNIGVINSSLTNIVIKTNNKEIYRVNLTELAPGYGWYWELTYLDIPSDFEYLEVVADPEKNVSEIFEDNNNIVLI
jgi:predicted Zn-dependent protease